MQLSAMCWSLCQRSRVRFPALPEFLSSSGSGTGSTQPREVNWGATWIKRSSCSRSRKQRFNGHGDPLHWPRDTPLSTKVGTNFADRRRPLCRYSFFADYSHGVYFMVAPTCFVITLPSSGRFPSAFWEMLNWVAVDRILWMGVLCLVMWCSRICCFFTHIFTGDFNF